MKLGILEQSGSKSPALLSAVGSLAMGVLSSRTVNVTPPAGTTMAVGLVGLRTGGSVPTISSTLNGVAGSIGRATGGAAAGSAHIDATIRYWLNPTIAAQDWIVSSTVSFDAIAMRMFFLSGAGSVGTGDFSSGDSAGLVTNTIASVLSNAFIASIMFENAQSSSATAQSIALTNLTLDTNAKGDASFDAGFATAYNGAPGTGSINFSFDENTASWFGANYGIIAQSLDIYQ